jgi:hypothetical protein
MSPISPPHHGCHSSSHLPGWSKDACIAGLKQSAPRQGRLPSQADQVAMPSRNFVAVDLVAKPLDVKTWPARPVSGLAAGSSSAGRRGLFASGGCSRMLAA